MAGPRGGGGGGGVPLTSGLRAAGADIRPVCCQVAGPRGGGGGGSVPLTNGLRAAASAEGAPAADGAHPLSSPLLSPLATRRRPPQRLPLHRGASVLCADHGRSRPITADHGRSRQLL